jgi:hypothetical protein
MAEAALRIEGYADLDEAKICYWHVENRWLLHFPHCGIGDLRQHTVAEHENGTITVKPSIKVTGHNEGRPVVRHGHLTEGVWTEI